MSDLEIQIPTTFDPFKEATDANAPGTGSKDNVHVRIQQRNGRKSLTTVQGLKKEFNYSKILKDFKKEFCCNGTVVQDPELGNPAPRRSKKERFAVPCAGRSRKEGPNQNSWFLGHGQEVLEVKPA